MARRISVAFPTLSANGSSSPTDWPGGKGDLTASGTFGGGTLTMQIQGPSGTWINVINYATITDISITGNKHAAFELPAGPVRVTLAGATGPSVTASVSGIPANVAG